MLLQHLFRTGRRDDDGASSVEYGLLIAAIAAVIVIVVFVFGGVVKSIFDDTCDTISASSGAGPADCAS